LNLIRKEKKKNDENIANKAFELKNKILELQKNKEYPNLNINSLDNKDISKNRN
jgi:hypothetical protein